MVSDGAGYFLGVIAVLLVPALIAGGLWFGTGRTGADARSRFARVAWFGVGLFVVGFVLVAIASMAWLTCTEVPRSVPFGAYVVLGLVVVVLVVLVVALDRLRRLAAGDESLPHWWQRRPGLALVSARRWAWVYVAIFVALAGFAWLKVPSAFREGLPNFVVPGFAVGFTTVVAGLVVLAVLVSAMRRESLARSWLPSRSDAVAGVGTSAGVGVVAAVATMIAITVLPVDAVTAEQVGKPVAAVPESVSRIAWQWEAPAQVEEAVQAGPGLVVRIGDGVVGLDTTTGRPAWHYRRPGGWCTSLSGAPDGGTVTVRYYSDDGYRLVVLNAFTGEVRAELGRFNGDTGVSGPSALTSRGFATRTGEAMPPEAPWQEVTGYAPDTVEERWTYSPPDGCVLNAEEPRALHDVIAVLMVCGPGMDQRPKEDRPSGDPDKSWDLPAGKADPEHPLTMVILGLDPARGTQKWRYVRRITEKARGAAHNYLAVATYAAADGSALAVWVLGENYQTLLSQADGKALTTFYDPDLKVDDPTTFSSFTTDAILTNPGKNDRPGGDFSWEQVATGIRRYATVPWPDDQRPPPKALPLRRALLSATWSKPSTTIIMNIRVTPWGTGKAARIQIPVRFDEDGDAELKTGFAWPSDDPPLFPTPGAVTFVHSHIRTITGLV